MPLANSFSPDKRQANQRYPLHLMICSNCSLCQLESVPSVEKLYNNYKHSSSDSIDNLRHLKSVARTITERFFNKKLNILEIGCNDGSLLTELNALGHNTIGVDPAKTFQSVHKKRDVKVITSPLNEKAIRSAYDFFGKRFDAIVGINVFAHFENVAREITNFKEFLTDDGLLLLQVAYSLDTILQGKFDTIYHEHVFNWSGTSLNFMLNEAGFYIDEAHCVDQQGGSIFVVARKLKTQSDKLKFDENEVYTSEQALGISSIDFIERMRGSIGRSIQQINDAADKILSREASPCILAGAPARGVTLVHATDLRQHTNYLILDDSDAKKGAFFPGLLNRIEKFDEATTIPQSNEAIVLSWNYKKTMISKLLHSGFKGTAHCFLPEYSSSDLSGACQGGDKSA